MNVFKGLYQKELKLSFQSFLIGMILIFFVSFIAVMLKEYFQQPFIPAIIFFLLVVLHAFYLPGILFSSLQMEGQSQLWLHNPNGGTKLLLAKIAAGLTYLIVSIALATLLLKLSLTGVDNREYFDNNLFAISIGMSLTSVYIGVWVIFYWTFYHSLKNIPALNKIRWLVLIAVWFLLTSIGSYIRNRPFFQVIEENKALEVTFFQANQEGFFVGGGPSFNLGSIAIYAVVVLAVFFTSVWLLERKVEV